MSSPPIARRPVQTWLCWPRSCGHGVDEPVAAALHGPQVHRLPGGLAVEGPRPARAVLDGADAAERLRDRVAVERGGRREGPAEHRGGVVGLDRVAGRRGVVGALVGLDEGLVGRVVELVAVVQRRPHAQRGVSLGLQHAALGEEPGAVQRDRVLQAELGVLGHERDRLGAGEEAERRPGARLLDLGEERLVVLRGAERRRRLADDAAARGLVGLPEAGADLGARRVVGCDHEDPARDVLLRHVRARPRPRPGRSGTTSARRTGCAPPR